jgi:cardiolipin synthase A/B
MKQDTLEGKAKTKNGVKRLCFSIICILLEVIFIITIVTRLNEYAEIINLFTRILSGILVLGLYASNKTSSMKMPWVILILIFPIMGVGLYLLIGLNGGTHKMRERYAEIDSKLLPMLSDNQECLSRINETIPKAGNIASYIQRNSQYPIYQNTDIVYFDEAVKGLEAQLKDLEKAQKFIFMEYHANIVYLFYAIFKTCSGNSFYYSIRCQPMNRPIEFVICPFSIFNNLISWFFSNNKRKCSHNHSIIYNYIAVSCIYIRF